MDNPEKFIITTREETLLYYFGFFQSPPTLIEIDEREISGDAYGKMVNWISTSLKTQDNRIVFLWNDERRTIRDQYNVDSADLPYNLEESGPTNRRRFIVRYDRPYRFYFEDDSDAMAFKLRWA